MFAAAAVAGGGNGGGHVDSDPRLKFKSIFGLLISLFAGEKPDAASRRPFAKRAPRERLPFGWLDGER